MLAVDLLESVSALETELSGEGRVLSTVADVAEPEQVEAYVTKATDELGGVDFFFNNAGVYGGPQPWIEYPVELFDKVIRVNVRGVWLGIRAVMPAMIQRGGGAIVNSCSIASLRGYGNLSPYIASKHAVLGMTRVASVEGAEHGIRVNAVAPGVIDTPMGGEVKAGMGDGFEDFVSGRTPMDRLGTSEGSRTPSAICSPIRRGS